MLGVDSYDTGIQTLVHRYGECHNNGGDCVEKQQMNVFKYSNKYFFLFDVVESFKWRFRNV